MPDGRDWRALPIVVERSLGFDVAAVVVLLLRHKAQRVYHFHSNTMEALSELVAAIGLDSPEELRPWHMYKRIAPNKVMTYDQAFRFLDEGELLEGGCDHPKFERWWEIASPETFAAPSPDNRTT